MDTNNNLLQFITMIKNNRNPQQFVTNLLQERANQNPAFTNLIELVKKEDTKGIEQVVRNIAQERGVDFDKEFNSFKQMFKR